MTPIPWTTLTAEEKRGVFWKSMGVESKTTDYLTLSDEVRQCEVWPDLTLDALFEIASKAKLSVEFVSSYYVPSGDPCHAARVLPDGGIWGNWNRCPNPIDALAIALLRHAGFEVLTEGKV